MSKSEITKIKSVLNEINESRAKATQGYWDDNPATQEWKDNKINNAAFLRLAANKITALTRALEAAVDALEDIEGRYEHPSDLHNINSARLRGCQLAAKSSISKIAEILEVKP